LCSSSSKDHIERFSQRLNESRRIEYVLFYMPPSQRDAAGPGQSVQRPREQPPLPSNAASL
jgi:hypothetical protein